MRNKHDHASSPLISTSNQVTFLTPLTNSKRNLNQNRRQMETGVTNSEVIDNSFIGSQNTMNGESKSDIRNILESSAVSKTTIGLNNDIELIEESFQESKLDKLLIDLTYVSKNFETIITQLSDQNLQFKRRLDLVLFLLTEWQDKVPPNESCGVIVQNSQLLQQTLSRILLLPDDDTEGEGYRNGEQLIAYYLANLLRKQTTLDMDPNQSVSFELLQGIIRIIRSLFETPSLCLTNQRTSFVTPSVVGDSAASVRREAVLTLLKCLPFPTTRYNIFLTSDLAIWLLRLCRAGVDVSRELQPVLCHVIQQDPAQFSILAEDILVLVKDPLYTNQFKSLISVFLSPTINPNIRDRELSFLIQAVGQ